MPTSPSWAQGGWLPLLLAAIIYAVMTAWKADRRILAERIQTEARSLDAFLKDVQEQKQRVTRVPGTAIFMNGTASKTPAGLRHNLQPNKVLHDQVVFVTVKAREIPHVAEEDRLEIEGFGAGVYRVFTASWKGRIFRGLGACPNQGSTPGRRVEVPG